MDLSISYKAGSIKYLVNNMMWTGDKIVVTT